jgi:hypothetical protein
MKKFIIASIVITLVFSASIAFAGNEKPNFTWKACWGGGDPEAICSKAKEIGFNAFIVWNTNVDYLKKFAKAGKKYGIETYFSISASSSSANQRQVMSPHEQEQYKVIKSMDIPALCKIKYQWGGEPVKKKEVYHGGKLACFHRPEVLDKTKSIIKNVLDNVPDITGLAIDGLGYQNYHCCYCDYSMKLFEEYRKKHKHLSKDKALNQFSLEKLVEFNNELTRYAKSIKPDIKTTCHVYPVFLPEILYGNRLDVDYCGETVAWFFKPFWSYWKIKRYTKTILKNQSKYFNNQKAVAMIGFRSEDRCKRKGYDIKTKERIKKEILTINKAGCDKIMFCCFNIVKDKEIADLLKELFAN